MTGARLALFAIALLGSPARAADCLYSDALGTARVMSVDPKAFPRVGLKSFPQTLPLADKEVVLTFDDGPLPATTNKVLAALAAECVQATFFLIGQNAKANPQTVRAIAAGGHDIGHHTWSHRILNRVSEPHALDEIDRGIAADDAALGAPATPFFRFPGFASTPSLLARLQARGFAVFGADLWASDWNPMTPDQQLHLLTARLEQDGRGIILLHDTKRQTAAMLPAFLRYLKRNNYKVVHVVPSPEPSRSTPEKSAVSRFRPRRNPSHAPVTTNN
ncbi:MAG: polysaccharide deacetylase family protein [Xanthobacteraceae bacterium]|nr:polysaccharide deacetylase family protein [Xanthobacteraceae bacterium]